MGPELLQSIGWAKTAVRSSLVPHVVLLMAPQGREMHPRRLTESEKSRLGKQAWLSIVKYVLIFFG